MPLLEPVTKAIFWFGYLNPCVDDRAREDWLKKAHMIPSQGIVKQKFPMNDVGMVMSMLAVGTQ